MLQVYDRVLGSRSQETLAALFALVVVMFLILGMLDLSRSRVMARVALRFQSRIRGRVFAAMLTRASRNPADQAAASALRDLDMVQKTLASPVTLALLDLPWVPFYLFLVFLLHFWLGIAALAGGGGSGRTHVPEPVDDTRTGEGRRYRCAGGRAAFRPVAQRGRGDPGTGHARGRLCPMGHGAQRSPRAGATGHGPVRPVFRAVADIPAIPAIGASGIGGLACVARRRDGRRDDRRIDHGGPGAGSGRTTGQRLVRRPAGPRRLGAAFDNPVGASRRAGPDRASPPPRRA